MRFTVSLICWLGLCGAAGAGSLPQVELAPAQPAPGEVFRVTVHGVEGGDAVRATFGDREFALWQLSDTTWEGLAAVDREQAPGQASLLLSVLRQQDRQPLAALTMTVAPREYPEQHLRVQEGMVHLSPEDQERAARENRVIRKVLGRRTAERLWQTPFAMPLSGPVTSAFGVRRVYNGTPKSYHSGLDIAAPRGAPVHAAGAGTVALVGDYFYTGHTVFVDHGLGLYTAYFHLDTVAVREEQQVAAGGELGQVGSTGRSTGPHLHWGVYLSGRKADPLSLLHAFGAAGGGETP
ncbi:MAG: M23 family metallopeptidase [Deferrisomatales bacterium]|nr:M23 family metallopeptidase [Deferrisomatales bacterium]